MNKKDLEHLQFIYDRLILVHGENKNLDFMQRLYHIIQTNSQLDFQQAVVMEFSEEEIPIFTQGFNNHELLEVVTAERCNAMIKSLVDNYQNSKRYLRWRQDASNPEGLDKVMDQMIEGSTSSSGKWDIKITEKRKPTAIKQIYDYLSRLF